MEATHGISEKGFDQSSILESLQSNVNQVLKLKEQLIMLESQLKIAKEQLGLQDAEFAFQRSEYQADLDHLKTRETELLQEIARLQSEKPVNQNVNVEVQVAESKPPAGPEMQQWKSRVRELKQEMKTILKDNLALKTEIEELRKQLTETETKLEILPEINREKDELQHQLSNVTKELSEVKGTMKQMRHDLKTLANEHTETKTSMEAKLNRAQAKIEKQKEKMATFHDDQISLASATEEATSQLRLLENENVQIRSQAKDYRRELRAVEAKLQAAEDILKRQKEVLAIVESEHENLADLLGLEPDRFDEKWTEITEKVEKLITENQTLNQIQSEKEKLQKRLDAALEEQRSRRGAIRGKENMEAQTRVVQDLKMTRLELDQKTKMVTALLYRRKIARLFDKFMVSVSRDIFDLHRSICRRNIGELRPVVLLVIFAKRIASSHPKDSSFRSLEMFAGREMHSPTVRLTEVRVKFTELTQQLLLAKQNVVELTKNMANVTEERDIAQLTLHSNSREVKIYKKKMALVMNRMNELQEELSALVSPEMYNEVKQTLERTNLHVTELEERIHDLEREIESRNVLERKLRAETEQLEASLENQTEAIEEIRIQLTTKNEEMEEFKALLRDKTKEIFALERLTRRQRERESSTELTVNSLAAENKELQTGSETGVWTDISPLQSPPRPDINPAFLGQS
jgi:chromosome segregation protein